MSKVTLGADAASFSVGDTIREDYGPSGGAAVITAIDREAGTITLGNTLKRLYSDTYEFRMASYANLVVKQPGYQCTVVLDEMLPEPVGPIGAATIAVVTTVAALEWLRHRKAAVAAAENSEEAYRSLLSDFIVWLTALFAKMRKAGA